MRELSSSNSSQLTQLQWTVKASFRKTTFCKCIDCLIMRVHVRKIGLCILLRLCTGNRYACNTRCFRELHSKVLYALIYSVDF
uniref:Uncharacterized protein n=1 Tax=Physcomitrium patens TaxID=3218 RepID=A0A7I3ZXE4_PHYPA